ncbi:hypothetical protein MKZ07_05280 [Paenibacillus sp. FSL P4-0338]|uniref:RCC1-like domain-containing protein n=1 Tax=Paenibacillus sp. FSL P4-0338 TaxID=2921635 RepID=UPI0030FBC6DE
MLKKMIFIFLILLCSIPSKVMFAASSPFIIDAAIGGNISTALDSEGKVWLWGNQFLTPIRKEIPESIIQVAAGGSHVLALSSGGTVWVLGKNMNGQLGLGNTDYVFHDVFTQVPGITGIKKIAASNERSFALDNNGNVWSWGFSSNNLLGHGTGIMTYTSPTQVKDIPSVKQIVSSQNWTYVLTSHEDLLAWGNHSQGYSMYLITDVDTVVSGVSHSFAIKKDHTLWGWGSGYYGELGNSIRVDEPLPILIPAQTNLNQIAAGNASSFIVKSDHTVWSWGLNSIGQLGFGFSDYNLHLSPQIIQNFTGVDRLIAGENNTLAIKLDGTLWTWGRNVMGQLGLGGQISFNQDIMSPTQIIFTTSSIPTSPTPETNCGKTDNPFEIPENCTSPSEEPSNGSSPTEEKGGDFLLLAGFNRYPDFLDIIANITEWVYKAELEITGYLNISNHW